MWDAALAASESCLDNKRRQLWGSDRQTASCADSNWLLTRCMEYVAAHTRLLREPLLCQLADWVVINVSYTSGKWISNLCGQEIFVFVYHYKVQTSDALDPWWGQFRPPPISANSAREFHGIWIFSFLSSHFFKLSITCSSSSFSSF